ncbi:MAG: site-specific integrase [Formivibrio sp.]|nr:site-specific integrase [Formivibrio sp.]
MKGRTPETATFKKITDARAWAAKTEQAIKEGRHFGVSKRHTLGELLDRYEEAELPRLKSAPKLKPRLTTWRALHGATLLSDLTPDVIAKARDMLAAMPKQYGGGKRTAADVNRFLAALSSVCTYGVKELNWIERNPLERVSKGSESKGRVRYLSDVELPRFLKACRQSNNQNLYLAVVLALTTGGRKSETMGLRWSQIRLQDRTAMLGDTKNGDARALPLSGEVIVLLQERSKVRNLLDDRLFPPKPRSKSPFLDLRAPFATALKEAEIGDYIGEGKKRLFVANFRWHDLRHTCASYLAMAGTSPLEISKILGHRTMAMVSRYAHLSPGRVVELGDMLAKRMGVGN